jgi:hypothetical protein
MAKTGFGTTRLAALALVYACAPVPATTPLPSVGSATDTAEARRVF